LCRQNPNRKSIPCSGLRLSSDACFGCAIETRKGLSNLTTNGVHNGLVKAFYLSGRGVSSEKLPTGNGLRPTSPLMLKCSPRLFRRPTNQIRETSQMDKLFIRVKPADEPTE